MCTVIVTITIVKLVIFWQPTKLACWRNLALVSLFSTFSMHLYMGRPVVTCCPTRLFWTKSTKMIHFSRVPESNLGILIIYFSKVVSLGVLWYLWSIYFEASSSCFSGLARGMMGLTSFLGWVLDFLGNLFLNFHHFVCLVNLAICWEVKLLCPMLKICLRKTFI